MNPQDVADYAPIPAEGTAEQGPTGGGSVPATSEDVYVAPAASVREVSHEQAAPKPVYRYVVRPAPQSWHIYEETTGARITNVPLTSQHDAQDRANTWNRQQSPP